MSNNSSPPANLGANYCLKSASIEPSSSEFTAYQVSAEPFKLDSSPRQRQWMEESNDKFAYRCLPLVIANLSSWDVLCPLDFSATWDGGKTEESIQIDFKEHESSAISSHFGEGVLTFHPGYLFRTAPGYNLWVKGPANSIKDGIQALEGIVETDWAPYTFTMNWKFTRPGVSVNFAKNEAICSLVPVSRHTLPAFRPQIKMIDDNPALKQQNREWCEMRSEFIRDQIAGLLDPGQGWQKHYFQGKSIDGEKFEAHQTKIVLREFEDLRGKQ